MRSHEADVSTHHGAEVASTMILFDWMNSHAAYGAYLILVWVLVASLYRLARHPLRSYPGPMLARLSDVYGGYHTLLMRLHLATLQDHQKYGPVVRHGPDKLVFNSVQASKDIYGNKRAVKSHLYSATMQAPNTYNVFNVVDKQLHRCKRKLILRTITERSTRTIEHAIGDKIDVFIQRLRISCQGSNLTSQPINMTDMLKRLGIDVVGLLAFGYSTNTQTEPTHRPAMKGLTSANYLNYNMIHFPLLKKLRLGYLLLIPQLSQVLQYVRLLNVMISSRSRKDHRTHDLYSVMADAMGPETTDSALFREIWSEAVFFIPAGSETTSAGLSALFFYLSRNRQSYMRLAEEIRSAFRSGSEIRNGTQLGSCRYLRACIDEALRLSPPICGTLWREAIDESDEPFVIDGHVVPPGTQVGVNVYALHHNEEYFPDSFSFKPERWISSEDGSCETQRKLMRDAFMAFSTGARSCVGKNMAYLHTSLVIAKTLWYLDFETAPGKVGELGAGTTGNRNGRGRTNEYQLYDVLSAVHNGPNLVFHARGNFRGEALSDARIAS